MVVAEIRCIRSGVRELRKFGFTVGIVLCGLDGILWWRGREAHPYLLIAGGLLILGAAGSPVLLRPLHRVWMDLAILMGGVMTRLLLGILFFAVITPIGLLIRLSGKDMLSLRLDRRARSYWVPVSAEEQSRRERLERQF